MRDKKAYDMLVQAESGVVSVTGSEEAPAKVGISIADIASGMYAFSSILAALYARERTGAGERIDISMLECLTEWMTPALYVWQGTGRVVARVGVRHNMIVPVRRVRVRRRRRDVRHARPIASGGGSAAKSWENNNWPTTRGLSRTP